MEFYQWIILGVALLGGMGVAVYLPSKPAAQNKEEAEKKLSEAKQKAEALKSRTEQEIERRSQLLLEEEKELEEWAKRTEEALQQKENVSARREEKVKQLEDQKALLTAELEQLTGRFQEQKNTLVGELLLKSGLSREEASEQLVKDLDKLLTLHREQRIQNALEAFEEDLVRHAKAHMQVAMQRMNVRSSVDKNSTAVTVQEDSFKGLLIGKEGKNLKFLESLLPVSIIFNMPDPQTIYVGGVNLIRRNIAKEAIEKMQRAVRKGARLDHDLIQKTVSEAEAEIMKICDEKGAKALKDMNLDPKEVHPELVNYVGRMYYRTSYGQNIIYHSLEMAYLARLLADFTGADVNVAMQAAFYHDIGKAIDHDIGGVAHDDLSKEILEKHNYDPRIVHAAYAHHDKVPCLAPEDFLVKAVDALSGGRPGARLESVTNYFERMKQLEETAFSFDGVEKVLTMSAGREVRVRVKTELIHDEGMQPLADQIAKKISEDLSFPGIIKVNLQRITRSTDFANTDGRKRPKSRK